MGHWNNVKRMLREVTPPLLWNALNRLHLLLFYKARRKFIEWEYLPEGWQTVSRDPAIKGWNVESVLDTYKANWPTFVNNLTGTLPLGISPESASTQHTNLMFHNLLTTYGYVLARVTQQKTRISMLDWGGGIGHYYLLSRKFVPEVEIEYHCKDFPPLAEYGRTILPQAYFHVDQTCLTRQYTFVLASSVLHYDQDWEATLHSLARATAEYLFVTRLPIIHHVPSFLVVQRPYQHGYATEYVGWCLNRQQFLQYSATLGLQLLQEFIVEQFPPIFRAPEQPEGWGFLFRKV